jgi:twitching motility protein PilT
MASITEIFKLVKQQGASDVHLAAGSPPMLRLNDELVPIVKDDLAPEIARKLLYEIMTADQVAYFDQHKEIDFGHEIQGVTRLRCNIFEQRSGIAGVFRLIPTNVLSAEQLGLPKDLLRFCDLKHGLILVTGATGSGKSTTLAALVDHINERHRRHIITIEDPIEFVHRNKRALVNQRELGAHTLSFQAALKSALREDPDIILVGEMRDLGTIQLAVTAAETGHLVFGTLHTKSAHGAVDRIIDVFPSEQQSQIRVQLAESLKGVVAQRLLPKKGGSGRVAAFEILVGTSAVRNAIREGKTHQIESMMQTGKKDGMVTIDTSLLKLLQSDLIEAAEARRHAAHPDQMNRARREPVRS